MLLSDSDLHFFLHGSSCSPHEHCWGSTTVVLRFLHLGTHPSFSHNFSTSWYTVNMLCPYSRRGILSWLLDIVAIVSCIPACVLIRSHEETPTFRLLFYSLHQGTTDKMQKNDYINRMHDVMKWWVWHGMHDSKSASSSLRWVFHGLDSLKKKKKIWPCVYAWLL